MPVDTLPSDTLPSATNTAKLDPEFIVLDMKNPEHRGYFDQIFRAEKNVINDRASLYTDSFQDFERVPPNEVQAAISGDNPSAFIAVAVVQDPQSNKKVPVAYAEADLLPGATDDRQTVLLGYLANTLDTQTNRSVVNNVAGVVAYEALRAAAAAAHGRGQEVETILGEVNNPAKFHAPGKPEKGKDPDRIDPATRLQMYKYLGAQEIGTPEHPFNYHMPNLTGSGEEPDGRLLLLSAGGQYNPETGDLDIRHRGLDTIERVRDVRAGLKGYYKECSQPDHPRLQDMDRQLAAMEAQITRQASTAQSATAAPSGAGEDAEVLGGRTTAIGAER